MGLWDEVVTRHSNARLVELTNPDTTNATTIDTDRADAAVADAEAEFEDVVCTAYDGTNTRHVSAAVEGVMYYLASRNSIVGSEAVEAMRTRWVERLNRLARASTRKRIMPSTNSVLTVSAERANTSDVVRPDFDRAKFGDLTLRNRGDDPRLHDNR
jgi:hypothetical protein